MTATTDISKPSALSASSARGDARFSWITENLGSHAREYGGTFATEFTVLACQLLTYKLVAHFQGHTAFSEYAVARRTISLIYPLPLLGMAVALPRYIARATGARDSARSVHYFGAAARCVVGALVVSLLLMNVLAGKLAQIFFGSRAYVVLVPPLSLMLFGLTMHALVYSYFRGKLDMKRANVLQFVNIGLLPVLGFSVFTQRLQTALWALGALNTLIACLALAFTPWRCAFASVGSQVEELLRYGIQRVPGEFIATALLTLPTTFAAHVAGMQEAGSLAFGISVLIMIASVFSPVGLVLLPKASRMFASRASGEIALHVRQLALITFIASLSLTLSLTIFVSPLIGILLGAGFGHIANCVWVLVWGAPPFCLYYVLRGVVDAFHPNGINTRNLILSFLLFVLGGGFGWFIGSSVSIIYMSFLASLYVLGALTVYETRKIIAAVRAEETKGISCNFEEPPVAAC